MRSIAGAATADSWPLKRPGPPSSSRSTGATAQDRHSWRSTTISSSLNSRGAKPKHDQLQHALEHNVPGGQKHNASRRESRSAGYSTQIEFLHPTRWDRGEEGRLIAVSGGSTSTRLDPNIENTYVRQASAYVEREVAPDVGVRTGIVLNAKRQPYGTARST